MKNYVTQINLKRLFCRIIKIGTIVEIILLYFVWLTLLNFFSPEGFHLVQDFNFNFLPKKSVIVYICLYLIQFGTGFFFFSFVFFSLTFFVLFSTYILGQIELIVIYVKQLNLNEPKYLAAGLKEIIKLHLDALR